MSKTLKRPMFRYGGKANSKGTGITSGLEDREEYYIGGNVGGNQMKTILDYMQDPRFQDTYKEPFVKPGSPVSQMMTRPERMKTLGFFEENIPAKQDTPKRVPEPQPFLSKKDVVTGTGSPTLTEENETPAGTSLFPDMEKYMTTFNKESIEEAAKKYEDLFKRTTKEKAFDILSAIAPKILDEDYAGAFEEAREASSDKDIENQAKALAIQEQIDYNKIKMQALAQSPTKMREVEAFMQQINPETGKKYTFAEAAEKVYPSPSDALKNLPKERVVQGYIDTIESNVLSNDHMRANAGAYAEGKYQQGLHSDLRIISYARQDNKPNAPFVPVTEIVEGRVFFDPGAVASQSFVIRVGTDTFAYGSYEEALKALKSGK